MQLKAKTIHLQSKLNTKMNLNEHFYNLFLKVKFTVKGVNDQIPCFHVPFLSKP